MKKSIKLDDFISFKANNYTSHNTIGDSLSDEETKFQNIIFLIEISPRNLSKEDTIILKQAF